jgi:hypothetical protein
MRANERVLVQEDVEQIKITLAIVNGIDTWMITTTMLKSTHYLTLNKSKIDSIISYMKEKALKSDSLKAQ